MKPTSVALPAPRTRGGVEVAPKPVAGRAAARGRSRTVNLQRERHAPPFDAGFWAIRQADLVRAGFGEQQAAALIADIRRRVEPELEAVACSA